MLDLAWLTTRYGRFIRIAHAAYQCRSEEAELADFASMFPDDPYAQRLAVNAGAQSYAQHTASPTVWGAAPEHIQQLGRAAGIKTDFPEIVAACFVKAVGAGFGNEKMMVLFKVSGNYVGVTALPAMEFDCAYAVKAASLGYN